MSYKRMKADRSVYHDSDFSRLPQGAVIIKTFYKYFYEQVSYILEHGYQVICYKLPDGTIREGYRSKLDVLTSPVHPPRGELMDKAVNYLKTFWKQLFAYLNNGRYDIDNSIAERFIRPLAGERKNSLFFVGNRMAKSTAYHTLLLTCRMNSLSALEYLKKFFREVVNGVQGL